ncbi:uncharacterized protein E0L32_007115 [Thyridium curvatum]|uniref:F-box domain-containing protein n=1 Tax=Thyridium curvatum TaxID=1093900 RepID=A0A507B4G4_9PEZI|nr:uncharacterized protein E0L32_007115 [Thyridium curvatum]TPX12229.1 hypothetical protein E0L32_007115 [Thyridium curvatum]
MIEVMHISGDNGPGSMQGSQENRALTREEYAQLTRELTTRRMPYRTPKRAQSTTYDYRIPTAPRDHPSISVQPTVQEHPSGENSPTDAGSRQATPKPDEREQAAAAAGRKRPPLPPPRRSYSVMDYEPVPHTHRPSATLTLEDMPPELHYAIFDWLDPIDSTCLGLANKHFYDIHVRMHGRVPLSARRSGPNDMEWAWHLAGNVRHVGGVGVVPQEHHQMTDKEKLALLRVRGQALCRKCGVSRCELHKHIREWMGPGYEYCSVRQRFGPVAPEGASKDCYMSSPRDPHRCGRHRTRVQKPQAPAAVAPPARS